MVTLFLRPLHLLSMKPSIISCIAMYSSQPECVNKAMKVVNVAIIGAPNSGKSTLINNIVERKVCAASNKVHTTTKLHRAMCYQGDTQIVFLDTPGVATDKEMKRYNLPESMRQAYYKSLRCANVVGVVHDISNRFNKDKLHGDIVHMLETVQNIPSFLILNKVDVLRNKKQLLMLIRSLTNGMIAGSPIPGKEKTLNNGYSHFSDVFLVSALNGDGVGDIKEYLLKNAKPASGQYPLTQWSDQSPRELIEEASRAKFLDFLAQELPYNLKSQLEYFEENEEKVMCSVAVECPSERIAKLIRGAGDGRLQQIKTHIKLDLIEVFKKTVVLDLHLQVRNKASN